jgi:uncharacterized protein (DUF433 family)
MPEPVPLRTDDTGVIRVGDTRVTLDIVVGAFCDGATAEQIVQSYPTLQLTDVYAVIAYYLRHHSDVDAYIDDQAEQAARARRENERRFDPVGIRDRLMARRSSCQPRMLALVADENVEHAIIRGVRLRSRELDLVRVQDVGLSGLDDPQVLAWAANQSRVLLTHDMATMNRFAYERVAAGDSMPGVVQIPRSMPIGQAIDIPDLPARRLRRTRPRPHASRRPVHRPKPGRSTLLRSGLESLPSYVRELPARQRLTSGSFKQALDRLIGGVLIDGPVVLVVLIKVDSASAVVGPGSLVDVEVLAVDGQALVPHDGPDLAIVRLGTDEAPHGFTLPTERPEARGRARRSRRAAFPALADAQGVSPDRGFLRRGGERSAASRLPGVCSWTSKRGSSGARNPAAMSPDTSKIL